MGSKITAPFELEAEVEIPSDADNRILGLVYAGEFGRLPQAFILDLGSQIAGVLDTSSGAARASLRRPAPVEGKSVTLRVIVDEDGAQFLINDKEIEKEKLSPQALKRPGTIGVLSQGDGIIVKSLRILR